MLEAKFLPATDEGTPFETDHRIHDSFRSRRAPVELARAASPWHR